ncbi:magnesium transporter [Roseinatronobacter sp. S2]|uniref:magnesium transporter n=1 Tax=Roseinatronobacter sp. S2 TaxID=3035471 RepID=UPI00240F69BB|nr:magnesium transporter [Roseinatronobacter sp. S2]WFE75213.1 magnesium transporter [Roseinatronobacter sp. S2]
MPALMTQDALRAHLAQGDLLTLREAFAELHPADLANEVGGLPPSEAAKLMRALTPAQQSKVFGYFGPRFQIAIARHIARPDFARIVTDMSHDERADLWKALSADQRATLLPALAQAEREDIRRLAAYPEGTAGAAMTSDYATLAPDMTAVQAIAHLRAEAPDTETIYTAYVIDSERMLKGVVTLRDLILADERRSISDLMMVNAPTARVDEPLRDIAERIAAYDVFALPILTGGGRLVGIVTIDDALDIGREAGAATLARFGATGALRGEDLDMRSSTLGRIFRVRLVWLALLTVFGVVTAGYIAQQEALLAEALILAAFVAPIIDMGGNTGSQSATLVIRAMALGQLDMRARDVWFVIRREVPVLLGLGVSIAALMTLLAWVGQGIAPAVLMVIGLTMLAVTITGGLLGVLLPFAARRLGTDPAAMSAPLITSIMDLVGVVIYFAMAWAFLGHLLEGG